MSHNYNFVRIQPLLNILKPQSMKIFYKTIKNVKIIKRFHAYKGYASTYNVNVLNYLKPELQHKKTISSIENKLKDLLS